MNLINKYIERSVPHVLHPERILLLSFASIILIGSFLLMLPVSNVSAPVHWIDALFTATSAVCVTGLAVVDTGTTYTTFGQIVILSLIEIGGLGIMTFSTFFILIFGKSLSFRDRLMAKESLLGDISFVNLFSMVKNIFALTFLFQSIGAALLFFSFSKTHTFGDALYSAVFHSISAFCNAGFSIYSDNLMGYSSDYLVNLTIMALIVIGGLGFPVNYEIITTLRNKKKVTFSKLSLHTKLVLVTTFFLIIGGAICIYLADMNNPALHADGKGITVIEALFQSVTARTAGFNTVAQEKLTNPSLFFTIMLMYIGASPASTGGGVKTSTFAIFLALIRARFLGREKVELFKRTIPNDLIDKTLSIIVGVLFLIIFSNIALQITEARFNPHSLPAGKFLETLFEATSAFGTVGLSMGLTPVLTFVGKVIIIFLMYVGRVGPLTFAIAITIRSLQKRLYQYPEDSAMVG